MVVTIYLEHNNNNNNNNNNKNNNDDDISRRCVHDEWDRVYSTKLMYTRELSVFQPEL